MLKKGFLKPEISIYQIGRVKFWYAIFIGLLSSIILNVFFNQVRETFRGMTSRRDLIMFSVREYTLYD